MFSPLSLELTKSFNKLKLKEYGIYFTPKPIINRTMEEAANAIGENNITEILEPSCGSCEFVTSLKISFPEATIDCVEYNDKIYEKITPLQTDKIHIHHSDFLTWNNGNKKYNLIIGNPPYFVMKKSDVKKKYHPYFEGRPNIYIIFLLKCLEMLEINGVLSFVIPQNFLNCLYYLKTREFITKTFQIWSIVLCDGGDFMDTQQSTIILTVKKISGTEKDIKKLNNPFVFKLDGNITFNTRERVARLKELFSEATTLSELGVNVSVGNVVWNQCKDILTNDPTDTLLVYSSNIVDGEFVEQTFKNEEKKNYIKKKGITQPMMVINRGYGKGKYKMEYCVLNLGRTYLIENHLICLTSAEGEEDIFDEIVESLEDPRTEEFIDLYFGNNAINCSELHRCFPIYI
jgi:hypothetical protein